MKKIMMTALLAIASMGGAWAQAEITFDKLTYNFGHFKETEKQHATFTFKNTGSQPLVINQVIASCGCTEVKYDKQPIAPGASGQIEVTYNGKDKFPGYVKKNITVNSNAQTNGTTRLYIEGEME